MSKNLLKWMPLGILSCISLLIFVTNYVPGKFLLGWDNTVPELNLWLNLQRFIFGIWQEYRGLGVLDGMSHTSNLSYWLFVRILSFVMPLHMVRYVSNLLLHLLGGVGLYYLLAHDLLPTVLKTQKKSATHYPVRVMVISLMSAVLYMLNLMTIQMFVTPLELFSVHFAVLPWGVLFLRKYFSEPSVKYLLWLFIINFLGSSQAHVPTVFIPYAVAMAVFLIWGWLQQPKKYFKVAFTAGVVLFCAHAFWGVPYIYSTIHKSSEISNSKQNRLGTDGTFYRNLAWGHAQGVLSFGGFQLDYRDWSIPNQQFESIMKEWVEIYKQPWYQLIAISFSLCSLLGVVVTVVLMVRHRRWQLTPYLFVWFFGISMLGTDIPLLKEVSATLRNLSPLFYQIFRFTFTKFSILYVCFMSVMFAVFWTYILCRAEMKTVMRWVTGVVAGIFTIAIIIINLPILSGKFFYPALRVKLPDGYNQLFKYLDQNIETARLVTFPIHSLWGWTTGINSWGHRGSGFLWQVIAQPMVDRSFDPWSKHNETMYLQMSTALYSLDFPTLLKTFEKYHASTIFYDTTVFHPGGYPQNIFTKEIQTFLTNEAYAKLTKDFEGVQLYALMTKGKDTKLYAPTRLTQLSKDYQTVYTTQDVAYEQYGEYLQKDDQGVRFPLSILQSDELHKQTFIQNNALTFTFKPNAQHKLLFPEFKDKQEVVTVALEMKKVASDSTQTALYFNVPTVKAGDKIVYESDAAAVLRGRTDTKAQIVLLNDSFVEVTQDKQAATLTLPTSGDLNLQLFQETGNISLEEREITPSSTCESTVVGSSCTTFPVITNTSEDDTSHLITITATVLDSKGDLPKICIFHSSDTAICLNREVTVDSTEDDKVIRLTTSTVDTQGGEYGIRLIWDRNLNSQPWKSVETKIQDLMQL
jgi:hypothetical protein